jgi:alpha-galactosidase
MAKIAMMGAGSFVFTRDIITDILSYPELTGSTITLMDPAKERLELMAAFAQRLVDQRNFKTKIEFTTDRKEALEGADFVIISIRAGGWDNVLKDYDITTRLGFESSPDASGPTGIFAALRQIPAVLEICHDMEKICPDALCINYSNPMAMICWAINEYTKIKCVGLCPNPPSGAQRLAKYIGAPFEEVSYWAAGLNHFSWYLDFQWKGEDAYPILREKFKDFAVYSKPDYLGKGEKVDLVEVEMFHRFGYFTSGSKGHIPTYTPYFRRSPAMIEKYQIGNMGNSFKIATKRTSDENEELKKQLAGGYKFAVKTDENWSKTSAAIMNSMLTGIPCRIDGNVRNTGLITNLLEGCCVEVPCLVDKEGVHPCYVGNLPPQCAALNANSVFIQELTVRGTVEKDKTKLAQAILSTR